LKAPSPNSLLTTYSVYQTSSSRQLIDLLLLRPRRPIPPSRLVEQPLQEYSAADTGNDREAIRPGGRFDIIQERSNMATVSEDRVRRGAPRASWAALLALVLVASAGCGRERGRNGNGARGPMSMEGNYEDTGLPKRITFDGKTWEIGQDIDAPAGSYEKGTEQVNGQPVYHDPRAEPPYTTIYLRVPGKDRFLQYVPAGGKSSP
jgi:hypothetical protein